MKNRAYVTLFGNLVRDPVLTMDGVKDICRFTVAVDIGDPHDPEHYTNYYDCEIPSNEKPMEFYRQAQKGTQVYVYGSLTQVVGSNVRNNLQVNVNEWEAIRRRRPSTERTEENNANLTIPAEKINIQNMTAEEAANINEETVDTTI